MTSPQTYEAWKKAVAAKQAARNFLAMIGKQERGTANSRTPGGTFGKLSSIEAKATIHYQPSDGATNYHSDVAFNLALSEVVKARFAELAAEAEAVLEAREKEALRAMRDFVDRLDSEVTQAEQAA